jgi:hypothetical protein
MLLSQHHHVIQALAPEVTFADGISQLVDGLKLDGATSTAVFDRLGTIQRLKVFYGLA